MLGEWPPAAALVVTTAEGRIKPGWDGLVHPVVGVASPEGTVLSVPPFVLKEAQAIAADGGLDALASRLGRMLGRPGARIGRSIFRWSESPTAAKTLPDAGEWVPFDDERVPDWLRPFGGPVLVTFNSDGAYAAGVGVKRHDQFGQELAVGTEDRYAGHGLGRRLVAQAARHLVAQGIVPTYLHDPNNFASAKVADAAGFPDRGWKILGLWG
jgi:GNAT superfamily N-acetyltransferase